MDRKQIKQNAKAAFRMRYWPMVGIELLAGILAGGTGSAPSFTYRFNSSDMSDIKQLFSDVPYMKEIAAAVTVIAIMLSIVGMAYIFLFGNAVRVGISGIRLSTYRGQSFRFTDLFSGLKRYGRVIGTMALQTLFIALGFLCFIVPGIIVAYGLFEVPYLLADDPTLSGMAAISRSWADMKGYKWKLFVLNLSFFGWGLLSVLTLGILAIFFVGPYAAVSEAGFYHERQQLQDVAQTAE